MYVYIYIGTYTYTQTPIMDAVGWMTIPHSFHGTDPHGVSVSHHQP